VSYTHEIAETLARPQAPGGLAPEALAAARAEAKAALERLLAANARGAGPRFLRYPALIEDRPPLERAVALLRARARTLLVLGTGGSSLGAQAIAAALAPGLAAEGRRVVFLDNVDPAGVARAWRGLDPAESALLVVSKSGETAETLALALDAVRRLGARLPPERLGSHCLLVSQAGDNPLRRLALRLGAGVLDHDPRLGGRFSVLSLVGLLPALFLGLDAFAVRAGAAEVLARAEAGGAAPLAPPAEGAALTLALLRARGIAQQVLFAYCDALEAFGLWWRQLVAESLGKDGRGLTPLSARGTTDQHSQLQLYLAGPTDKFLTLIEPPPGPPEPPIDAGLARALGLPYLADQTLGALFAAEATATARTLEGAGRPLRRIGLSALDARTLGALFMHFMLEVVLLAELLGVNAFDQPAVEEGKVLVRRLLGAPAP
jgi:glucose-6-phosphate isomerase